VDREGAKPSCCSLDGLTERPFRTLPGGLLRKFPRGLGQFPPSFQAESRWDPAPPGQFRSQQLGFAERLPSILWRGGEEEKEMLKAFLNYGLVAAVLVWAGVVAMMAYRLEDSPWRWVFVALAVGGVATVAAILKIRKYVDGLNKGSEEQEGKS
jgi:hypothetical protein